MPGSPENGSPFHHPCLLGRDQIHIRRVIQNPAAVAARDQFLLRLAHDKELRGDPHMAASANTMLNTHHDILAFVLHEPIITRTRRIIDRPGQFRAVGQKFSKFFLQIAFAGVQRTELLIDECFGFSQGLGCPGDLFLAGLSLFHERNFLVFDFENGLLAQVNFMRQRAVFLVLASLKLLIGVLGNEIFLGLDFQFQFLAAGFNASGLVPGSFQRRLRMSGLGLEGLPFGFNVPQLSLHAPNLAVAVL